MSTNSPKKWLNLEEHFFAQMDQQLLEKLRQEQSSTQSAAAIMKVTGIADEGLAKELASVGITIETLTAFRLVPMVMVAWADDRMEESERRRHSARSAEDRHRSSRPGHGDAQVLDPKASEL